MERNTSENDLMYRIAQIFLQKDLLQYFHTRTIDLSLNDTLEGGQR